MKATAETRSLALWRAGGLLAGGLAVGFSPAELQLANTVTALTFWVFGGPLLLGAFRRFGPEPR
ncbi:MAG: hypothetical protein HUU35_11760 [Armatimonadetes bacterium]|nr:hypothetical protein [Armatimonadota bacterium]